MQLFFFLLVSISTWSAPQPQHSAGLIVIYGNQMLVEANADWRGYDLGRIPERCGLSAISPAHLGQLAWVRVPGGEWIGPCTVVDAVSRHHAYDSIYVREEIAEVSRTTAAALGITNGGVWGRIWFGACPPEHDPTNTRQEWNIPYVAPKPYAPPLIFSNEGHESFYPYPAQERPQVCP